MAIGRRGRAVLGSTAPPFPAERAEPAERAATMSRFGVLLPVGFDRSQVALAAAIPIVLSLALWLAMAIESGVRDPFTRALLMTSASILGPVARFVVGDRWPLVAFPLLAIAIWGAWLVFVLREPPRVGKATAVFTLSALWCIAGTLLGAIASLKVT